MFKLHCKQNIKKYNLTCLKKTQGNTNFNFVIYTKTVTTIHENFYTEFGDSFYLKVTQVVLH